MTIRFIGPLLCSSLLVIATSALAGEVKGGTGAKGRPPTKTAPAIGAATIGLGILGASAASADKTTNCKFPQCAKGSHFPKDK